MENSQLLEFVGETYTEKLRRSITKEYFELKKKSFPDSKNLTNSNCLVSVFDKGETEIKSIGMSCINDLLLDNFGIIMKLFMKKNQSNFTLIRKGGAADDFNRSQMWTPRVSPSIPVGSRLQIGQGLTPAARTDNQIETPFTNGGVEDSPRNTFDGVHLPASQESKVGTLISPTAGSGAISEVMLFLNLRNSAATVGGREVPIAHENISPVVNFNAAQTITIDFIIGYA